MGARLRLAPKPLGIWDYRNPMFTGIYRNPILITEFQLYYQVYHDLYKFRHI